MIDVRKSGETHVQLFRAAGLSAFSWLLTVNEAQDLLAKLRLVLEERERQEALIPDD